MPHPYFMVSLHVFSLIHTHTNTHADTCTCTCAPTLVFSPHCSRANCRCRIPSFIPSLKPLYKHKSGRQHFHPLSSPHAHKPIQPVQPNAVHLSPTVPTVSFCSLWSRIPLRTAHWISMSSVLFSPNWNSTFSFLPLPSSTVLEYQPHVLSDALNVVSPGQDPDQAFLMGMSWE